jgi:hypothetical protein
MSQAKTPAVTVMRRRLKVMGAVAVFRPDPAGSAKLGGRHLSSSIFPHNGQFVFDLAFLGANIARIRFVRYRIGENWIPQLFSSN